MAELVKEVFSLVKVILEYEQKLKRFERANVPELFKDIRAYEKCLLEYEEEILIDWSMM